MSKNRIWILFPLGLLLLSLVALAGCRPSTALTSLMNAMNALNPTQETVTTEEEQEENTADEYTDPIDEERDDAKIEEMETLIGKMLDNMDEETAEAALDAVYSAVAETDEWGVQEYNPDRIIDAEDEDSALAMYIRGRSSLDGSGTVGTTVGSNGTTTIKREGLTSSNGRQSSTVPVTQDPESTDEPTTSQTGGQQGSSPAYGYGDGSTSSEPLTSESTEPDTSEPDTSEPDTSEPDTSEPDTSEPDTSEPETTVNPGVYYGHTIAATGEAAVLVCMLGGADRLVATNEDFYNDPLVQEAWGDQLHCEVLWSGDGTTALDGGSKDGVTFKRLMEDIQPDLCVEFEGYDTFSNDEQVTAIRYTYGIGYYPVTAMTSQTGINNAVTGLAISMDQSEGSDDAWQIAQAYLEWCRRYLSEINASTDMEVAYIEGWDNSAEIYRIGKYYHDDTRTLVSNEGMAYIRPGTTFRPLSTFLGYANVTDYAANPVTIEMMSRGSGRTTKYNGNTTEKEYTMDGDYCVVSPLASVNYNGYVEFSPAGALIPDNMSPGITEFINFGAHFSFDFGMNLGASDSNFKTVIAKDQATADAIQSSWQWDWSRVSYEYVSRGGNAGWDGWFYTVTGPDGIVYPTNIMGRYEVIVQPAGGIGSWVEGSPESILETIWAACKLQGCLGNNESENQNRLEYIIDDFYRTFYGFSPYDSGMMDTILAPNQ